MAGFGLRGIPHDIFQSSLFAEFIKFIKYLYIYIDLNFYNDHFDNCKFIKTKN